MPQRNINRFDPTLEGVSFQNTRFDSDQARFGRLARKMAAAFGVLGAAGR